MASKELYKAAKLAQRLRTIADDISDNRKSGDVGIAEQLSVFAELLVALSVHLDRAQQTVKWLTWVLTVLTALLVAEAGWRALSHFAFR